MIRYAFQFKLEIPQINKVAPLVNALVGGAFNAFSFLIERKSHATSRGIQLSNRFRGGGKFHLVNNIVFFLGSIFFSRSLLAPTPQGLILTK